MILFNCQLDPSKSMESKKIDELKVIIKRMNDVIKIGEEQLKGLKENKYKSSIGLVDSELNNNTSNAFENFFMENEDFLKFSKKFQPDGWQNILGDPYKNQAKFQFIIEKYLQKMLEVK